MHYQKIIKILESLADPESVTGMERYGIIAEKAYGIRIPELRVLAKQIGKNQELALRLWDNNTRETRILASMIAEPKRQDEALMEAWVREFSYWEICDQVCMNLFEKSPLAYAKAVEWSQRQAEFEKRAGFVLMARLAVSDKQAPDDCFLPFFEQIIAESADPRNFVKKAVNWALRQIGKRNRKLNLRAIEICHQLLESQNSSSSWIARDALRELESLAIQKRLKC